MRVLQLVPRLPYPPDDGGKIGILGILDAFVGLGHQVRLLGFDEEGQRDAFVAARGSRLDAYAVEGIPAARILAAKARVGLGVGTYLVDKYWSPTLARRLVDEFERWQPDLVHLDHSHMGSYGLHLKARHPHAMICMRAHNVESVIWHRRAQLAPDPLRRAVFARQARLAERAERVLFERLDGVVSISEVDTAMIRAQAPGARVYEMPAGYQLNRQTALRESIDDGPRLCFVGSLDYTANRDGLAWFMDSVWPALRARFPAATLQVAGRSAAAVPFLQGREGVSYHGFVSDVAQITDAADIAVVPLRIGGGIRLKILDFLSRGLPIIATRIGAEGTQVEHAGGDVLRLAEDAAQFVAQVESLQALETREGMAERGRALIAERYDWQPLVRRYCDWVASNRPSVA